MYLSQMGIYREGSVFKPTSNQWNTSNEIIRA